MSGSSSADEAAPAPALVSVKVEETAAEVPAAPGSGSVTSAAAGEASEVIADTATVSADDPVVAATEEEQPPWLPYDGLAPLNQIPC